MNHNSKMTSFGVEAMWHEFIDRSYEHTRRSRLCHINFDVAFSCKLNQCLTTNATWGSERIFLISAHSDLIEVFESFTNGFAYRCSLSANWWRKRSIFNVAAWFYDSFNQLLFMEIQFHSFTKKYFAARSPQSGAYSKVGVWTVGEFSSFDRLVHKFLSLRICVK